MADSYRLRVNDRFGIIMQNLVPKPVRMKCDLCGRDDMCDVFVTRNYDVTVNACSRCFDFWFDVEVDE